MSNYTPVNLAFHVFEPSTKSHLPDLIAIHGITANKESWLNITKDLANKTNRKVFALDMRNHGDSSWSDEYGWHIMAKDVIHFMEENGINCATILGHSMGGIIAMILALTEPEKIHSIIVEDITPILKSLNDEVRKGIVGRIDLMQASFNAIPPETDFNTAVKSALEELAKHTPPELQPAAEHRDKFAMVVKNLVVKKDGKFVLKGNTEAMKKFLLNEEAHKDLEGLFEKPADFIYGTISPFKVPDAKDRILQLFPKAKLHPLEGATHLAHIEYPDEFMKIILPILSH